VTAAGAPRMLGRSLARALGVIGLLVLVAGCSAPATPGPVFGGKEVQADQKWPQELMGGDGSTVLLYQPQVESWKDYKLLRARMAVAFRRMGTANPTLGGVLLEGDTSTSSAAGQVRISNIRIVEGRFGTWFALGLTAVLFGLSHLFNPNAIRASAGTVFTVPTASASTADVLAWLRGSGVRILATRVDSERRYSDVDLTGPVALVLGAEDEGLTNAWNAPDIESIRLPMSGIADSLNVSVTAAVVAYEARRQRGDPQRPGR